MKPTKYIVEALPAETRALIDEYFADHDGRLLGPLLEKLTGAGVKISRSALYGYLERWRYAREEARLRDVTVRALMPRRRSANP
jgi:hypothetical protein